MNRAILVLVMAAATLPAQPLARGERDRAMSGLHATRKMFLDSIASLTEEQWRFKPAPDRWSAAECAEHVALSEDALFKLITGKILKTPPAPEKKPEVRGKDDLVEKAMRSRDEKFSAPGFLQPAARWTTKEAVAGHFKQSRDRTIAYVENTTDELRNHFYPQPAVGLLDAYQWILLVSAHSERHTAQIEELKTHPDFPRN